MSSSDCIWHCPDCDRRYATESKMRKCIQRHLDEVIEKRVEAMTFERDGRKFISLGYYCLDFKSDFVYLGMTKGGMVKLGDIVKSAYNGEKEEMNIRFGKIYDDAIHVDGSRYIERLPSLEDIKRGLTV